MTDSSVKQQRVRSMRYHDDFDHERPVIGVNDLLVRKIYSLDGIKFLWRETGKGAVSSPGGHGEQSCNAKYLMAINKQNLIHLQLN